MSAKQSKRTKIGLGVIISLVVGVAGFMTDILDIKDRLFPSENAAAPSSSVVEMDTTQALMMVYGQDLTEQPDSRLFLSSGEEVRVVLSEPYQENDTFKYVLISQRMDPVEFCHLCAPLVDGAILVKIDEQWHLSVIDLGFDTLGYFGIAPDAGVTQIGPDRFGYLFYFSGGSTGLTYTDATLVAPFGERFDILFKERTQFDNSQACEPDFDFECWGYTSMLEFIQGENALYYDLKLSTRGDYKPDGEPIIPYDNVWIYRFSTGENRFVKIQ